MARISPEGRWLAFLGNLDGQQGGRERDLYVQTYPEGTPFRVTQTGVEDYAWEPGDDGALSLLLTEGGAPAPGGDGKELRRVRLNESGGALQAPEFEDVGVSISTQGTFRTDAQGRIYLMEPVEQPGGPPVVDLAALTTGPALEGGIVYIANLFDELRRITETQDR